MAQKTIEEEKKADQEQMIAEVMKNLKPSDIHLDCVNQVGVEWVANGRICKYGGKIHIDFSFKLGKI